MSLPQPPSFQHIQLYLINKLSSQTRPSQYEAENRNKKLNWQIEVLSLDIEGELASAKVKIYNQNFGYLDYFNFMEENGKWLAVSKISKKLNEI